MHGRSISVTIRLNNISSTDFSSSHHHHLTGFIICHHRTRWRPVHALVARACVGGALKHSTLFPTFPAGRR
jgi:hypothetical protein